MHRPEQAAEEGKRGMSTPHATEAPSEIAVAQAIPKLALEKRGTPAPSAPAAVSSRKRAMCGRRISSSTVSAVDRGS
jgi:hypothetical protein